MKLYPLIYWSNTDQVESYRLIIPGVDAFYFTATGKFSHRYNDTKPKWPELAQILKTHVTL